jgi:hypothetical protein
MTATTDASRGRSAALLLGAGLLLTAVPSRAAWTADPASNLPVCTSPVSQDLPDMVPDGSGGVIIVWQTTDADGARRVVVQRIDREGKAAWGGAGVAVCGLAGDQERPKVAADAFGGAIVVWQDHRSGSSWDVVAQRIDRTGRLRWPDAGIPISSAAGDQLGPQIAPDGHGGALIAWQDLRVDPEADLYAQAIDSTGRVHWSPDGIPIFAGPGAQLLPSITAVAHGGVFLWSDSRGSGEDASIRAQRIGAAGDPVWDPSGVLLDDGAAPDARPVSVAGGHDGVIVAWGSGPIRAQRLDAAGRLMWGDDGIALASADATLPAIATDGAGGAIVAWQTGEVEGEASDLRAQSVRASGTLRWGADGIAICRATGAQTEVVVTPARAGGVVAMWRDARDDPFGDLYAQRADSAGTVLWQPDGIVVSDAPGFQSALVICGDGRGGVVAAWTDDRAGRHIYAQRVDAPGTLGSRVGADGPTPQRTPMSR